MKFVRPQPGDQPPAQPQGVAEGEGCGPAAETGLVALGCMAAVSPSGLVEAEALFMLCAHAALHRQHRSLVVAILDALAAHFHYATRYEVVGPTPHRHASHSDPVPHPCLVR